MATKPKRGPGRPPIGAAPMTRACVALSKEQREKLRRLGGSAWIRRQIDKAEEEKG